MEVVWRTVWTKYGSLRVRVFRLMGERVLALANKRILGPDHLCSSGKRLDSTELIPEGVLFLSRRSKSGRRKRDYQIYGDIYSAIRGLVQIIKNYRDNEIGEAQKLNSAVRTAHEVVVMLMSFIEMDDDERAKLSRIIESLAHEMRYKRDEKKVRARDYFGSSVKLRDKRNRLNPPATSAKITAAGSRLELRLGDIRYITPRLNMRLVALIDEKNRCISIFNALGDFLDLLLAKHYVFVKKRTTETQVEHIEKKLRYFQRRLKSVNVVPFLNNARLISQELGFAINLLKQGKVDEAAKELRKSRESIRFKIMQNELEEVILLLSLQMRFAKPDKAEFYDRAHDIYLKVAELDETDFQVQPLAEIKDKLNKARSALRRNRYKEAKRLLKEASSLM